MNTDVSELVLLRRLTAGFVRASAQLNAHQESDAELVRLPGRRGVLAVTTDVIAEEIEAGLYVDPHQIGWMTVLVNASDLAAVGAQPIGILIAETLPRDLADDVLTRLQGGIAAASDACGLPVLGGDTNLGAHLQLGGTAIGWIPGGPVMTRRGAAAGDRLYASGRLGGGSAYALRQLRARAGTREPVPSFQPRPRLREGQVARRHASSAMDTSDGALAALDQLARINGVGFTLAAPESTWLQADAGAVAAAAGLPAWMMLAGPHGEFELVITIAPSRERAFLAAAAKAAWTPVCIGTVTAEAGIRVPRGADLVLVDTGRIRNVAAQFDGDVDRYLDRLRDAEVTSCTSPSS